MSNEVKGTVALVLAAVFLVIFAFTNDPLHGVITIWYAIFTAEYGIKHHIDEKEAE